MSSDVQEQINSEIFESTPIWNSKDVNHKNRRVINQLWEEIKNEMNIEVTDLKKKLKNIKDHYRKELKKIPASRSGDAGYVNQPSNWQYFSHSNFLRDEILPNVTEGASISSQESSTSSQEASTPSREASTSERSRKKKTANEIRTEFLELESKRIRLLENDLSNQSRNETSRHENKSDNYYFLMSLCPQIEKFTPVQKFRVRQKINQAVLDELSVNEGMYPSNEPFTHEYNTQH
ncbi:unnamed protein product [Parnassius mnemosyne]|uniref:MADF domain-containing protein n=1 Tax=Parnassius mnemosyne TaxID=213953 RepID=A0AAV1KII3_9NEOP